MSTHAYVCAHTDTHKMGIYCHIWELYSGFYGLSLFENEEHVNAWPQSQTGTRSSSTEGSHIQHQHQFLIGYEHSSINWAVLLTCYGRLGGPICHVTDIDCLCSHFLQHKGSNCHVIACGLNKTKKERKKPQNSFFTCSFPMPKLREEGKLHPRIH